MTNAFGPNEFNGLFGNSHASAVTGGCTSSFTTVDDVLESVRKFEAAYPPSTVAIKVTVGESVYRRLMEVKREDPRVLSGSRIEGLVVELDPRKPAQWSEVEYLDGHTEIWTPAGWIRGKPAR